MRRRIIWLVVSVLMVLSLVLASCAPKVTEEKEVAKEEVEKEVVEKEVVEKQAVYQYGEAVTKEVGREVPKYGGTMNIARENDPNGFDLIICSSVLGGFFTLPQTNDSLLAFDRTRGPGGTSEWTYGYPFNPHVWYLTANLAESWEMDLPNSITLHIRKGVRFQDKPPANGREMTAGDVVFSLRRLWGNPGTYAYRTMGGLRDMKNVANSIYLDPDDPWAVVVESNPELFALTLENATALTMILPKEVGETALKKWQDAVGTGPFYLTDYVSGSSATLKRNPNYWKKDPLYPQNQLPYVDVLKVFIMPDWASRLAALQTGKIDRLDSVARDSSLMLWRYSPELLYIVDEHVDTNALSMRHDVKPFDDVRVRRAMMMAIDHEAILRDYYGGQGELFYWPAQPVFHPYLWTPLEEMPEIVQLMYGYHPDEAMKLLDEAGYPGPKRFTTSVTAWETEKIEVVSIVADYWAKVGVTLNIDVREYAVFQTMLRARTFPNGSTNAPSLVEPFKFCISRAGASRAVSAFERDYIEQAVKGMSLNLFNKEEQGRIIREVQLKGQEEALFQILPFGYSYRFWQPWLKEYLGEAMASYQSFDMFAQYAWIDQELKQKMTGRR